MSTRREFITLLGGAATAWPLAARAQQQLPVIGLLSGFSPASGAATLLAFRQGLSDAGFVEHQNIGIEYRWAEGRYDRLAAMAADLARREVAVILTTPTAGALAAKAATTAIPVVFLIAGDPVQIGLVSSLNRPGGNLTGATFYVAQLVSRQLAVLHELLPGAATIGVLVNPNSPANVEPQVRDLRTAANALGLRLHVANATNERDAEAVFATLANVPVDALFVTSDGIFSQQLCEPLIALAARYRLPALYGHREYVEAGGLICYTSSVFDAGRQAGVYAGRILKGANPADLPITQPTKFDLVINLKTAKALRLNVPDKLLAIANEVIELKRRDFITLLGGAAVSPLAARAQQPERMRRIGVFVNFAEDDLEAQAQNLAFLQGLQHLGWTNGRNVRIDTRWTAGDPARARKYAAELVALEPDVVLAKGTTVLGLLLQATLRIPIVFVRVTDPVGGGFVASLALPGGNATGFTQFEYSMAGKWLELLKEISPRVTRAAVLRNPTVTSGVGQFGAIQSVAPSLGVELRPIDVRDVNAIESGVAAFAGASNGGLIVTAGGQQILRRELIITLAARHKLPAVYSNRSFVTAGGLMSYGTNLLDLYRRAAGYVDRILKGEKPADLPVQTPTKYELVINLKTAKALGLTVPATLLARADEVIE